ncbi:MAG TPA: 50S ribosomal protein L37e [Candidatus Nanoarchaeia archaeon]|nr:50S ribosomal protein L37e [Candidatus Nanoarchaeia archaeon]
MKGTASQGQHGRNKVHIMCRRCGRHAYHATRNICASCGYGKSAKMRSYNWQNH